MTALTHYIDLVALNNPELSPPEMVSHLMQQVHYALPVYEGQVAVDFPQYGQQGTLGNIIRLLGSEEHMAHLWTVLTQNIQVLSYARICITKPVPAYQSWFRLTRQNLKSPAHIQRLKRRHQERGTWTPELEAAIIQKYANPKVRPHVRLKSSTQGGNFVLAVKRARVDVPHMGTFSSYGLSLGDAVVPGFD